MAQVDVDQLKDQLERYGGIAMLDGVSVAMSYFVEVPGLSDCDYCKYAKMALI